MPLESATYISDLNTSNPVGSTDKVQTLDDHVRLLKSTLKTTFPSITGAVTATHSELNVLDGITATVAELNILDGVTATASELNVLDGITATVSELNLLDGVTAPTGSGALVLGTSPSIANLTVTGTLTLPSTSVADAALSANVPLKNAANTFSGNTQRIHGVSEGLRLTDDASFISFYNADNDTRTGYVSFATSAIEINANLNIPFVVATNNVERFRLTGAGVLETPNTAATELGYKGVPIDSRTSDFTVAAAHAGRIQVCSSSADDVTVQASGAPPAGSVVFIENATGGAIDILQGTGMTLTLDGTATTGSRTLAAGGTAYIRFTSSSAAKVGGPGVG